MEQKRCPRPRALSSRALIAGILPLMGLLSVAGFFGRLGWLLELASHFPLQYAMILAVGAVVLLPLRRYRAALIAGGLALFNLALVLSEASWTPPPPAAGRTYRLVFANVCFSNRHHNKVLHFVADTDADLVVLTEMNDEWFAALRPLQQSYPYCTCEDPEDPPESILWSRLPVDAYETLPFSGNGLLCFQARIALEGRSLTLVGMHTTSPRGGRDAGHRNLELAELGQLAAARTGPLVVVGDLNCTPWSPYFHDLLGQSGLRDSRQGFGLQPSWPAWLPVPGIPIDHCLVSGEVEVIHRRVGPNIGSDHYPIVIDFTLK